MIRRISWLINAALLAVCCFLLVRITSDIWNAFHRAPPELVIETANSLALRKPRSWSDREVILTRNLFNTSLFAPPEPLPPPEAEVEETELPLGLLGTISSFRSELRSAAIWDAQSREGLVVKEGDDLADGLATVVRIERGRVLLSEMGRCTSSCSTTTVSTDPRSVLGGRSPRPTRGIAGEERDDEFDVTSRADIPRPISALLLVYHKSGYERPTWRIASGPRLSSSAQRTAPPS